MVRVIRSFLPLLATVPRAVRQPLSSPQGQLGRAARLAIPLQHHAIQELAQQLEIWFPKNSPAVYVHEGTRQALERKLTQVGKQPVVLAITDNRHSMIHAIRQDGILRVRLHHMFLEAPTEVIEALGRFLFYRERDASTVVDQYIDTNTTRIRLVDPKGRKLRQDGKVHNLLKIFDSINHTYFNDEVDARIAWSTNRISQNEERMTIKLGSYSAHERLIRIHPRLDQKFVPRYFISFVVYHEMLHHVIPAQRVHGRRILHPPEFRERERAFLQYARAVAWEEKHIPRLLR